jgi:DNA-binding MarR family transcriptional regulator
MSKDTLLESHLSSALSLAIEVETELRRLTTEIDGLDEHAAQRFGINRTDMRCLDVLTSRGSMRPSELAAAVRLTSGGLSIALERLERAGYVSRRPHGSDRRSVLVEATEKAHQVDEEIFGGIEVGTRGLLRSYDEKRLIVIRDFLRGMSAVMAARDHATASGPAPAQRS